MRFENRPVVDIFEAQGTAGLEKIPYIGQRLAQSIKELAETGNLALLQRLLIEVSPEDLFTTIPGIGHVLARRLYRGLGLRSLVELEQAAQNGTLSQVPGFGSERITLVRSSLKTLLDEKPQGRERREQRQRAEKPPLPRPSRWQTSSGAIAHDHTHNRTHDYAPAANLLLEVDAQYRYLAKAGQLRMVTPKRFNPEGKPWLPVMQLKKDGWTFNVLYSNTARAHDLNKTHDWVVVNYERSDSPGEQKGQCTVVTETRGLLRGQRVIRGQAVSAA